MSNKKKQITSISERAVFFRKEKGLSQQSLADKLGLSRGYIGDIERGRSEPSFNFLTLITSKIDISTDWLLTGKGTMLLQAPGRVTRASDEPDLSEVLEVVTPDAIFNRLSIHFDVEGAKGLSAVINKPPAELAKWRQQGKVPYEACERIAKQENISLKWLITGFGDKNSTDTIDRRLYIMNQLMESLPENQQQDFLSALQEKERINQMERELAELKAKM